MNKYFVVLLLSFYAFASMHSMEQLNQSQGTKRKINNLNNSTTVRDIIISILPGCDPIKYSFYIHIDYKKKLLNNSSRIYKIVSKINKEKKIQKLAKNTNNCEYSFSFNKIFSLKKIYNY